jgi:hypothetical protein
MADIGGDHGRGRLQGRPRRDNRMENARLAVPPGLLYGGAPGWLGFRMEFRILGPLEVLDEGRRLALGGRKPRALLALLLHRGETLGTERLIDELWGSVRRP